MALFAEVRRMVGSVCRTGLARSERQALFRTRPTHRSSSLNRQVACMAVAPYSIRQSCTMLRKQTDTFADFADAADTGLLASGDRVPECRDLAMVSVTNLKDLLEVLPKSSEELSNVVDHICDVRQTLCQMPGQNDERSGIVESLSATALEKFLLDGIYLDRIFNIDREITFPGHSPKINGTDLSKLNQSKWTKEASLQEGILLDQRHSLHKKALAGHPKSVLSNPLVVMSGHVLLCESAVPSKNQGKDDNRLPSLAELDLIRSHLVDYMPYMFIRRHDYRIYTKDLVFENNFVETPYVTVGLSPYVMYLAKCRVYAHFKYANVKMHVLKATLHQEDGSVRIRWRVSGIPQIRAFMFWKFLPWKYKESVKEESEWLDGFSTFYVQPKTGLVYKHRIDKMIPDDELMLKKEKKLEEKLRDLVAPV